MDVPLADDLRELIVEPPWVALSGEDLSDSAVRADRMAVVVDYAHLAELGADMVKTEFSGYVGMDGERAAAGQVC